MLGVESERFFKPESQTFHKMSWKKPLLKPFCKRVADYSPTTLLLKDFITVLFVNVTKFFPAVIVQYISKFHLKHFMLDNENLYPSRETITLNLFSMTAPKLTLILS